MPCIRSIYIDYINIYGFNRKQLGFNRSESILLQFIIHEYAVRSVFLGYGR